MADDLAILSAALDDGRIGVLVSDLDGVLRRFDDRAWSRFDDLAGVGHGAVFRATLRNPLLQDVLRGRATHAQWRTSAVDALIDHGADFRRARDAVDAWAATPAVVDPDVAALLRTACERDVPVFVFTNGTDRVPAEMADLELDEFTAPRGTHLLNSAELGAAKPHIEAYDAARARISHVLGRPVEAADIWFLDDSPGHIAGACAAGWHAVLRTP